MRREELPERIYVTELDADCLVQTPKGEVLAKKGKFVCRQMDTLVRQEWKDPAAIWLILDRATLENVYEYVPGMYMLNSRHKLVFDGYYHNFCLYRRKR